MLKSVEGNQTVNTKARAAAAALQKLCVKGSVAGVMGPVGAGTDIPASSAIIALKLASYSLAKHTEYKQLVAKAMAGAGFTNVSCDGPSILCTWENQRMQVVLCGTSPAGVLQLLDPTLSTTDSEALSSGTVTVSTAFLQQQPALYKTAARVAKAWVYNQLKGAATAAEPHRWALVNSLAEALPLH
jgi:hypothetical protein